MRKLRLFVCLLLCLTSTLAFSTVNEPEPCPDGHMEIFSFPATNNGQADTCAAAIADARVYFNERRQHVIDACMRNCGSEGYYEDCMVHEGELKAFPAPQECNDIDGYFSHGFEMQLLCCAR